MAGLAHYPSAYRPWIVPLATTPATRSMRIKQSVHELLVSCERTNRLLGHSGQYQTVRRAMRELRERGLIASVIGKGTYVTAKP